MTALARRLQSRGNEIVFFGVPDVETFARTAGLDFVPYGEAEFPVGSIDKLYSSVAKGDFKDARIGCSRQYHRTDIEAPFYSERERAALALTDAVTRIIEGHVSDAVFERARAHFNEQERIALVFALTTINAWNRLAITMRTEVGNYQPKARPVSPKA
jgi:UDP:flavonoid glycosyltransferase YjiC (YdhE family)